MTAAELESIKKTLADLQERLSVLEHFHSKELLEADWQKWQAQFDAAAMQDKDSMTYRKHTDGRTLPLLHDRM